LTGIPPGVYQVKATPASQYQAHTWSNVAVEANLATTVPTYYLAWNTSKIGFHIDGDHANNYGTLLSRLQAANIPIFIKGLGLYSHAGSAKGAVARSFGVGRTDDLPDGTFMKAFDDDAKPFRDPKLVAANIWAKYRDQVCGAYTNHSKIDCWEVCNEWDGQYEWQSEFYIALMDLAEADGYRLALFSCSTAVLLHWLTGNISARCARGRRPTAAIRSHCTSIRSTMAPTAL